MDWYKEQIANCTYRKFTTGFIFGKPNEEAQIYDNNTYLKNYTYLGIVDEIKDGLIRLEQKNKFSVGEEIEIMKPDGSDVKTKVLAIYDSEMQSQESAPHARQLLWVKLDRGSIQIRPSEEKKKNKEDIVCKTRQKTPCFFNPQRRDGVFR